MNMTFYTYIYYDDATPIYVGKGKGKRAYAHLTRAANAHFQNKLHKMEREGRTPRIEIFHMPDENSALELEMLWIALFGRKDLGLGTLLNLTDGGEGKSGAIHSDQTKAKIGASQLGMSRRPHSDQTKAKMSSAKSTRCTIDDVQLFQSKKHLGESLGWGKTGIRHPNFKYLKS